MSSYFLALIDIHDPVEYDRYLAGFDEILARHRGEVLAVEDDPCVLEGDWPAGRTVLIRFPDAAELLRWYRSDAYQALARHRRRAATARIAAITGRD
jgi:uncharacterized protein (DUF1330 family)